MLRHLLVTLILAAPLVGCSSHRAPTLIVSDVKVVDRTSDGVVLRVSINAENRNEIELPLREMRYTLKLSDGSQFSGVRSAEASLRRLGTQTITVPASFPIAQGAAAWDGAAKYEFSGDLSYITPGEFAQVLFDTGVRRPSVSFRSEGTVEMDKH